MATDRQIAANQRVEAMKIGQAPVTERTQSGSWNERLESMMITPTAVESTGN